MGVVFECIRLHGITTFEIIGEPTEYAFGDPRWGIGGNQGTIRLLLGFDQADPISLT
jgi:hypothetical protein